MSLAPDHKTIKAYIVIVVCFNLSFLQLASPLEFGTATHFAPPYFPTACYGDMYPGIIGAKVNDKIFNGGAACGQFYWVTCIGGTDIDSPCRNDSNSALVKVVDRCNGDNCGTFTLTQDVFNSIADIVARKIRITYFRA